MVLGVHHGGVDAVHVKGGAELGPRVLLLRVNTWHNMWKKMIFEQKLCKNFSYLIEVLKLVQKNQWISSNQDVNSVWPQN